MPPSFQMKVWWGQKCSFSLSLFVLTQLQTTLKTTMAACSSIPTRILLPLGAMSQLQQLSSSSNRLSQDKEPRRMPTFILSLPHLSFQMLMKARKFLETPPQETVLYSLPWTSSPTQCILEVGSLGVAMSFLLSSPEREMHPSSLQETSPGLL